MPNEPIRILNFDDSVTKQQKILSSYEADVIGLRDIAPGTRFWLSKKEAEEIIKRVEGSDKSCVTFLGSGDFHHVSSLLISRFSQDLSVIDFDLHPDWSVLPPGMNCGSWVTRTLKNKNIRKFIIAGMSSEGLSGLSMQAGDFGALKDDRLEVYPYSHRPSVVFGRRIPDNISIEVSRAFSFSRVYWNELKNTDITEFFLHIIKRMPVKDVYLTIDKDCLQSEYALTNWEEGRMSLDDLLVMIKIIKDNLNIIGADITGDYSRPETRGIVKSAISCIDHPKDFSAKGKPEERITEVNEDTNLRILELLVS